MLYWLRKFLMNTTNYISFTYILFIIFIVRFLILLKQKKLLWQMGKNLNSTNFNLSTLSYITRIHSVYLILYTNYCKVWRCYLLAICNWNKICILYLDTFLSFNTVIHFLISNFKYKIKKILLYSLYFFLYLKT